MPRPRAIAAIVLSCTAIAASYAASFLPGGAPAWAPWLLALGSAGVLAGAIALGAVRAGRLPRAAAIAAWLTFAVVALSFALALSLPAREGAGAPLWAGLPVRSAIVLVGVGLLPLLFLPLAFALAFDEAPPAGGDPPERRDA